MCFFVKCSIKVFWVVFFSFKYLKYKYIVNYFFDHQFCAFTTIFRSFGKRYSDFKLFTHIFRLAFKNSKMSMFNEVQNSRVTKLRYETKLRKMTSQVKKKQHRVTNSIVKLF